MNTFQVEQRLKAYDALGKQMLESKSLPLITDGCALVNVEGNLQELNVQEQIDWIPLQLKEHAKKDFRDMEQYEAALTQRLNSAPDFQRMVHENQRIIRRLEVFKQLFLSLKHQPKTNTTEDSEALDILKKLDKCVPGAFDELSEVGEYRLAVMQFLRGKHGNLRVSTRSLHSLSPTLKQEARDFLYTKLGNNPKAKQIIDEVLKGKKPRKSKIAEYP